MVSPYKKYKFEIKEQFEPFSEKLIVKIFKLLDEEKKNKKKKSELLDYIGDLTTFMGLPEGYEIFLLELFLLNYRKDGDYSNLTKENFVDPRKMKGKWTPNTNAKLYTKAQLPFKGSNLEGYWTKDNKGTPVYVVTSYGWYPIYIFKNDMWYQNANRYSSSTGRQMSNSNPVDWDENLDSKIYILSKDEMNMLLRDSDHEDIMKHKLKRIKELEPELVSKRTRNVTTWGWSDDDEIEIPKLKIKFKVKSINVENDVAVVVVDVYDVLKREYGIGVDTPENYLKGELGNVTKEYVENEITKKLKSDFAEFLGPRSAYGEQLKDIHKLKFKFNHLKK